MIRQLKIGSLPLPKVYICDTPADARRCREKGVAYIIKPKTWSDDKLVKVVLYSTLVSRFPDIKWKEILFGQNSRQPTQPKVHGCIGTGRIRRCCPGPPRRRSRRFQYNPRPPRQ